MNSILLMYEEIPGSGKSTSAHKSYMILKKKNIEAIEYPEGVLHPANLDGFA